MKNYLTQVVLFVLVIIAVLFCLGFVPRITVFGVELRKVDILSDILVADASQPTVSNAVDSTDSSTDIDIDTLNVVQAIDSVGLIKDSIPAEVPISKTQTFRPDTIRPSIEYYNGDCKEGVTCIIDYSDSTNKGMNNLYAALRNLKRDGKGYARIAFFGDSFVEADILTADLRNALQEEYGGRGVGFVPITSEMRFFRRSVRHDFKGWSSYIVTQKPYKKANLGISGEYFIPTKEMNFVEYSGQSKYGTLLDTCQVASLFYKSERPLNIAQKINGAAIDSVILKESKNLTQYVVKDKIGKIRWTIPKDSTALFFGAALDGSSGVILDNFGQRGAAGYSLTQIPHQTLVDFNKYRPYDLIVLEYGLNVVAKNVTNYGYYKKGLSTIIRYLKSCFPNAGILIVGVADRDVKSADGTFVTMPEIKYFLETQRQIAEENKVAFWNMYEAMGGENSMVKLVKAKPAKANLDYTHINFIGGKYLGTKLFEAIVAGEEVYHYNNIGGHGED